MKIIIFKSLTNPKILQRFYKIVILGTLGMIGHAHKNRQCQLVEKFDVYLHAKNQLSIPSFLRYCKDIANLFWVHWTCLAIATRGCYIENFDVYIHAKYQIFPSPLSWNIAKVLQTCYFGYFGNAWEHAPKNSINLQETLMSIYM